MGNQSPLADLVKETTSSSKLGASLSNLFWIDAARCPVQRMIEYANVKSNDADEPPCRRDPPMRSECASSDGRIRWILRLIPIAEFAPRGTPPTLNRTAKKSGNYFAARSCFRPYFFLGVGGGAGVVFFCSVLATQWFRIDMPEGFN